MSSSRRLPSRWGLVAAALVLVLFAGGAFALGVFDGEGTVLAGVPEGAEYVATVDGAVVDDAETRALGDAALDAAGLESVTTGTALGAFQVQTGLGVDGVERVVIYGRYDDAGRLDSEYAAAIVRANWSSDSVLAVAEESLGWEYEQVAVGDATVYRPRGGDPVVIAGRSVAPLTVAAIDDGTYAVGTGAAVDDAVAVANGNAASVDGALHSTAAADDGLVTVASTVAGQWTEELDARTQGVTRLDQVRAVAATYDTPADEDTASDALRVRVRMHTDGTEAARDVAAFTRGGLPVLEHRVANATVARTLDAATVDRADTDVTVTVETTIDDLRAIATHYGLVEGQA